MAHEPTSLLGYLARGDRGAGGDDPRSLAPIAWLLLAVALGAAAIAATAAILNGRLGLEEWRVLATSLGVSVFSATGAAGASVTSRHRAVGAGTAILSGASFVLFEVALWSPWDGGDTARVFGAFGLATLAASHASLVLRSRRRSDGPIIRQLCIASILFACAESLVGVLPLMKLVAIRDWQTYGKAVGVLLLAMLLATALPPILRRIKPQAPPRVIESQPGLTSGQPGESAVARLAIPAALALMLAISAYVYGQSTRAEPLRYAGAQYVPSPATAPPPVDTSVSTAGYLPPPARNPGTAQATGLGHNILARPFARCPSVGGRREVLRGPDARTNFRRVELHRGARGVCLVLEAPAGSGFPSGGTADNLATVVFHPPGEQPHEGADDSRDVEIRLWTGATQGTYTLVLWRPGRETVAASVGHLGIARGHVSILIEQPKLPRWVLSPRTRWSAEMQ